MNQNNPPELSIETPEFQLLACCARVEMDNPHLGRMYHLLRSNLDWNLVYKMAQLHALRPLLYHHLNNLAASEVPAEVMARLRTAYYTNLARSVQLTQELLRVRQILFENDIPVLPVKGAVLANSLFPDPALREAGDIDLFIREDDFNSAQAILFSLGYKIVMPGILKTNGQKRLHRMFHKEIGLYHPSMKYVLELQFRLFSSTLDFSLNFDDLYGRRRSVNIEGVGVECLAPEDLLLQLCLHLGTHLWSRLSWFVDIIQLLRVYPDLDWHLVLERLDRFASNGERIFYLTFVLSNRLFDTDIPYLLNQRISSERQLDELTERVLDRFPLPPLVEKMTLKQAFNYRTLTLVTMKHWWSRCRYVFNFIFVSDYYHYTLPNWLTPLYFLIRPFRIAIKGLRILLNKWFFNTNEISLPDQTTH